MLNFLGEKEFRSRKIYIYLLLLVISVSFGFQVWNTLYNNFAVEVAGLNGFQNGAIQSIREVPGFLALLVVYLLLIIREYHLGSVSIIVFGLGVCLTGILPSFYGLIFTTLLMSFGFHYFETVSQSLTLQHFDVQTSPIVFGRLGAIGAATSILAGIFIYFFSHLFSYQNLFIIFSLPVILIGIGSLKINPEDKSLPKQKKGMVLKKKYWLYYVLTMLSGARRQVFIAFAVFLLVKNFQFSINTIAILFVINNVITYFFSPLVGRAINKFGERAILSIEYGGLFFIFLIYAFSQNAAVVLFMNILDHMFFSFAIGIRTYFHKIGDQQDFAPTMAVGYTINHIAAIVIPVVGGGLWMVDYKIPFIAGACLSLVSLTFVQFMKTQKGCY